MKTKKLALITGSSGRLGQRLAAGFMGAGYNVVGLDRGPAGESGGKPDGKPTSEFAWPFIEADVTDEKSVEAAFLDVKTRFGIPDTVIHTVGMWAMSPLVDTSLQDWDKLVRLNLTSTFLVFKHAIRAMDGRGSLIGIASRQGVVRGASQQAGYSASKAGVVRLIESIAAEYAESDLHAHALAPSTILFDEGQTDGVQASELLSHCLYLAGDEGRSLSGTVFEAYGNG